MTSRSVRLPLPSSRFATVRLAGFAVAWLVVSSADAQQRSPVLPDGVEVERDIAYVEGGHERQKLDLYRPSGFDPTSDEPRPLVVWIHGGGWRNGSKANALPLRQRYVEDGYLLASVGYRLTDVAGFPAQTDDCLAALRFLREHADEYGIAADRIAVWGASAGGHLAAMMGVMEADSEGREHVQPAAVVDYFGPSDLLAFADFSDRVRGPNSPEALLLRGPVLQNREKAAEASPVTHVDADDPPMLMVHGDRDPLVPLRQSERLQERLAEVGVEARLVEIRGGGHGGRSWNDPRIVAAVRTFLDEYLRDRKPPRQNVLEPNPTRTVIDVTMRPGA